MINISQENTKTTSIKPAVRQSTNGIQLFPKCLTTNTKKNRKPAAKIVNAVMPQDMSKTKTTPITNNKRQMQ